MLAKLAGKAEPTADDIKKILSAVDGNYDENIAKSVVDSIKNTGKSYEELVEEGKGKMAAIPAGGSGAAAAGGAAPAAEEKKEEKKEETEEEIIAGFGFDDDDD